MEGLGEVPVRPLAGRRMLGQSAIGTTVVDALAASDVLPRVDGGSAAERPDLDVTVPARGSRVMGDHRSDSADPLPSWANLEEER